MFFRKDRQEQRKKHEEVALGFHHKPIDQEEGVLNRNPLSAGPDPHREYQPSRHLLGGQQETQVCPRNIKILQG